MHAQEQDGDRSVMNDIDDDRDESAFAQLDLARYHSMPCSWSRPCAEAVRDGPTRSTPRSDALVHCSECQTSRAMAIKTIQPGMSGSRDEIIYQRTQCGTSKFAE